MLGLALPLSFAGQVWASGGGHVSSLEESVDGYKVALTFKAGQAQIGHNQLTVRIHDAQGKPVDNAKVTIVTRKYTGTKKETAVHGGSGMDMDKADHAGEGRSAPKEASVHGGGGMDMGKADKADHAPSEAALSGSLVAGALAAGHEIGEYAGEAETAAAGQWMIEVMFAVPGQEKSAAFIVDVKRGGPNWPVLWGFLIVNAAIIVIAAMTRKKSGSSSVQEAAL